MASLYDLKPRFQALLRPLAAGLARHGVSPNAVTLAAAGMSVATGGALLAAPVVFPQAIPALLLAVPPVLLARMALNALDGMMAREGGQATPLGALLNEAGDAVSDAALYLPLAALLPAPPALTVAAVTVGLVAEVAGLAGLLVGGGRRYDGPFGKSDRALLFGLAAVLAALGMVGVGWADRFGAPAVAALLAAGVAGGALTVVNRIRAALAAPAKRMEVGHA